MTGYTVGVTGVVTFVRRWLQIQNTPVTGQAVIPGKARQSDRSARLRYGQFTSGGLYGRGVRHRTLGRPYGRRIPEQGKASGHVTSGYARVRHGSYVQDIRARARQDSDTRTRAGCETDRHGTLRYARTFVRARHTRGCGYARARTVPDTGYRTLQAPDTDTPRARGYARTRAYTHTRTPTRGYAAAPDTRTVTPERSPRRQTGTRPSGRADARGQTTHVRTRIRGPYRIRAGHGDARVRTGRIPYARYRTTRRPRSGMGRIGPPERVTEVRKQAGGGFYRSDVQRASRSVGARRRSDQGRSRQIRAQAYRTDRLGVVTDRPSGYTRVARVRAPTRRFGMIPDKASGASGGRSGSRQAYSRGRASDTSVTRTGSIRQASFGNRSFSGATRRVAGQKRYVQRFTGSSDTGSRPSSGSVGFTSRSGHVGSFTAQGRSKPVTGVRIRGVACSLSSRVTFVQFRHVGGHTARYADSDRFARSSSRSVPYDIRTSRRRRSSRVHARMRVAVPVANCVRGDLPRVTRNRASRSSRFGSRSRAISRAAFARCSSRVGCGIIPWIASHVVVGSRYRWRNAAVDTLVSAD